MSDVQLGNGYLKIANETADQFCKSQHRLSGDEWTVLWVIIRKTYGFNKKYDKISLSQFSQITGMKRQNAHRALKKLSSKKIIGVIKEDDRDIVSYCFSKDYKNWVLSSKKMPSIKNDDKPVINFVETLSSKVIPTKDIYTKDNKDREKIAFVTNVFNHFCLKTGLKLKRTKERERIIIHLKDEPLENVKKAIDNFSNDDWSDRHKYNDFVYCLGTRKNVDNYEKWLNYKETPKKTSLGWDGKEGKL